MGKERSMTSVITMMQVLLFSMAAAVITVMAFGIAVQNHLQVRFMDRLEVSDRILEDLYVMEQEFREFGHEWGEESYSVYKEQVKQLENDLAEFREMSKDSSQTQNYIRRLNNFIAIEYFTVFYLEIPLSPCRRQYCLHTGDSTVSSRK